MTLEPVVAVVNADDLAYLRDIIGALDPIAPSLAMTLNGWTNESLRLGQFMSAIAHAARNGTVTIEPATEEFKRSRASREIDR